MEKVFYESIKNAIERIGLENFKKTSLFLSNEKAGVDLKKAA